MRMSRLCFPLVAVLAFPALAQNVPTKVNFTARMVDNGTPVQGNRDFVFKLFPTIVGGTETWTETRNAVPVTEGAVNVDLGASTPLTPAILDGQTLYLEVTVAGTVLTPRTPVVSVPYAVRSTVAAQVGTLTAAQIQQRVSSACGAGAAIQTINADGTVVCQAVGANDAGVTTITNITAGAGLTGGGSTGNVSLAVNFVGSGTAVTAARSDHTHAYLPLATTSALTCPVNEKVVSINAATGSVNCAVDANTTYGVAASGGLALNGATTQFSLTACTANQILVAATGGTWNCANQASGVTSVAVTTPLLSTGGTTPTLSLGTVGLANGGTGATTAAGARTALGVAVSGANGDITSLSALSTAISIAQGGTGSSTAPAALTALGAAASGANTDITSLSSLSTPLSAAQGGTGMAAPSTPGNFLKSTNLSTWVAGPIAPAEIPPGSNNYVQNQSASVQAASFFISGTVRTSGMERLGSELGTAEAPKVDPVNGGFNGMITRRINSTTIGLGSVVARTDILSFQRDGTLTGFRMVKISGAAQRQTVVCLGMSALGGTINKVIDIPAGAASGQVFQVYAAADDVVMMECVFGGMDTAVNALGNHTTVTLGRTNSGIIFFGTLTSTYNQ